jgi:anti-sigma regulatory factor (Ser/Thr protein kinase)
MAANAEPVSVAQIAISADLAELQRVSLWADAIASERSLQENTRFAIHLCLEEAVSNIIRHGCSGSAQPTAITIDCIESAEGGLVFIIEDSTAHFNPLLALPAPLLDADGQIPLGGRGIGLLRAFAGSLDYEPTATGNRLRIGFPPPQ